MPSPPKPPTHTHPHPHPYNHTHSTTPIHTHPHARTHTHAHTRTHTHTHLSISCCCARPVALCCASRIARTSMNFEKLPAYWCSFLPRTCTCTERVCIEMTCFNNMPQHSYPPTTHTHTILHPPTQPRIEMTCFNNMPQHSYPPTYTHTRNPSLTHPLNNTLR